MKMFEAFEACYYIKTVARKLDLFRNHVLGYDFHPVFMMCIKNGVVEIPTHLILEVIHENRPVAESGQGGENSPTPPPTSHTTPPDGAKRCTNSR